ncbi:WW domain containing protein [Novymonas esmeraldas]|uniref:WW domain containing protein n=1 Tax=Novymonas esmeraldas TaxID=1808958 RepID=A0AAW0ER72_9TRYP
MNDIPSAGEVFRGEDGTVSTILPTNYGQDYEASDGELEEYAEYIGINPASEPALMWIAKEGLRAALPDGWRACQTDDNEVYYFNFQSGESLWDHPMDDHYKTKVAQERARRSGATATTTPNTNTSSAVRAAPAAAVTGSTKAIADSLFLRPSAAGAPGRAPAPLAGSGGGGTPAVGGRPPVASATDGASAPRAPPDVSDILALATAAPPLSTAIGVGRSTAPAGPARLKDAEAALRKRLEESNEAQTRALRIELDKKADAERQRLAEARATLQKDLDAAWEQEKAGASPTAAGTSTQRRLALAREVKQVEESWRTRLHEVGTRVRELQQQVEAKQQTLQATAQQSPEELRKAMEARNAAEVAQLRQTKKKESDVAIANARAAHASALADQQGRTRAAIAAAESAADADLATKVQARQAQNAAMLAALRTAVESKQADLAEKERAAAAAVTSVTATAPAPAAAGAAAPSAADDAAVAAAEAAAEAEVAEAKKASAAATAQLRAELSAKRSETEAALKALQQQQQQQQSRSSRASSSTSSPTANVHSPATGFSAHGVSPADQAKLEEEDQKLRDEADRAARVFEEETRVMVENRRAGRPLMAAPPAEAAVSVSPEAIASLARTAAQEQRTRDSENTRHSMAMKQLEAKHDQAVRALRAQQDKTLAATSSSASSSSSAFNPRQHPSFSAQLAVRKRVWLRDHPPPMTEMPTLPPVPAMPVATMQSNMADVRVPDEEEQAKRIKSRLAAVREEVQQQHDAESQLLRKTREAELETWRVTYRSSRVAEVEKAVAAVRAEAAAAAAAAAAAEAERRKAAQLRAQQQNAVAAAAAAAATRGDERVDELQAELQALAGAAAAADAQHERQIRTSEARIAELEALLAELRTQEQHESEVKAMLLRQPQRTVTSSSVLGTAPTASTPTSASTAAGTRSDGLYIEDGEAAAEEAALRARWTALLKALRAAVLREMESYEVALDESQPQQPTSAAAAGARAGGATTSSGSARWGAPVHTASTPANVSGFLPPPAPSQPVATAVGGGAPAVHTAVGSGQVSLSSAAAPLSCYTTPIQRQTRDHDSSVAAPSTALAASSAPQLHLVDARRGSHVAPPVQRPLLSPSPQPHPTWFDASGLSAADVAGAAALRGGYHDLYRSGQRSPAPADYHRDGGAGEEARVRHHAAHLAALQQLVRAGRRDLQQRRREMELLREEWRADQSICKQSGDRAQARQLRGVKAELEARARELNEDVLRLKEMHDAVREEVRHLRQWMSLRQQQPAGPALSAAGGGDSTRMAGLSSAAWGSDSLAARTTSPSVRRGDGDGAPTATASVSEDVLDLLRSMMIRTERLEELLRWSRVGGDASAAAAPSV